MSQCHIRYRREDILDCNKNLNYPGFEIINTDILKLISKAGFIQQAKHGVYKKTKCGYSYIFFPRGILYNFFLFLLIYGGLGFGVLGSYFGFLGLGLSVDGVWGLWCGAFWVFGFGLSI